MIKLTLNEIKILNAMRENEYQDSLEDGGTWCFTAVDNSGLTEKVARGVISSLIKKELVQVYEGKGYNSTEDPSSINFTDEGKKLFDTADGKKCSWGGKPLINENKAQKQPKTEEKVSVDKVINFKEKTTPELVKMAKEMGIEITSYKDERIYRMHLVMDIKAALKGEN